MSGAGIKELSKEDKESWVAFCYLSFPNQHWRSLRNNNYAIEKPWG